MEIYKSFIGEQEKFGLLQKEVKLPTRQAKPRSELRLNYTWIKRHGAEHEGRWVALSGGKLIAVADTHSEVVRMAHVHEAGPFLIAQL